MFYHEIKAFNNKAASEGVLTPTETALKQMIRRENYEDY